MYGSGEFEQNRQNLQNLPSFWAIKNTNFKNMKKNTYHHLKQVYLKSWSHVFPFLSYGMWQDVIVIFHFGQVKIEKGDKTFAKWKGYDFGIS